MLPQTIEVINIKSGKPITLSIESRQEALRIQQFIFDGKIKLAADGQRAARILDSISKLSIEPPATFAITPIKHGDRITRSPPRNLSLTGNQDLSRIHEKTNKK